MKIDLHIHSNNSDGEFSVKEIINEASLRGIGILSITDHDNIDGQLEAKRLTKDEGIRYTNGVELNVIFSDTDITQGKDISLDLLGYDFDTQDKKFQQTLKKIRDFRLKRIEKIFKNINAEFKKESINKLEPDDLKGFIKSVDGTIGRPHLAQFLITKGKVNSIQEAFDKYLIKCDEPKYRFLIEEAAETIRNIGGNAVLAHPNDWHGTSLTKLSENRYKELTNSPIKNKEGYTDAYLKWLDSDVNLSWQKELIENKLIDYLDGIECWHSRHGPYTSKFFYKFTKQQGLLATGGSDCHQHPIMMGNIAIPKEILTRFLDGKK